MAFCSLNSLNSLTHFGSTSLSSINSSISITKDYIQNNSWPYVITGGTQISPIIITIAENLSLSSTSNYIIVNTDYVIFEGSNNTITFSNIINYNGLIQNGSANSPGFNHIYVQNLTIIANNTQSTPSAYISSYAGWFGQKYFGINAINNIFNNCLYINNTTNSSWNGNNIYYSPYGSAASYGGGISGAYTTATAINCGYYSNVIWHYAGGIFGAYSIVKLNNCYSMITGTPWGGGIFDFGGGLVGAYATADISCCFVPTITTGFQGAATIAGAYTYGKISNSYANPNLIGENSYINTINTYSYSNTWVDSLANNSLIGVNNGIWTDVNLNITNVPYVLSSFNTPIYTPSYPVPTLLPSSKTYIDITTISGLKLWLDASSSSSFTNSGGTGAVTGTVTWRDKSGLGNDMVSGNNSNGAYLTTFTSKPAVFFPRSINILTTPNINVQIFPMTYFVVICANASTGDDTNHIFTSNFYDANGNPKGGAYYNGLHLFCDATNGIGVSKIGGGNTLSSGLPNVGQSLYIFTIQLNTSGSTTSSTVTNLLIKTNGTTVINQAFSNTYVPNYGPTIQPRRGSLYISEMIYYQSLLSISDIVNVEAYLANKWGISISQSYPYFPYQIPYKNNFIITSLPLTTPIGSSKYNNFTLVKVNGDLPSNFLNITINTTYGFITFDNNTYDGSYTLLVYAQNNQTFGTSNYSVNTFICDISAGNPKNIITTNTTITQSWVNSHLWPCYIQGGTSENPILIHITESITFTNLAQYFVIQSDYITVDACNNTVDGSYNVIYISNISNYQGVFRNGAYNSTQTISPGYNNITIQNIIVNNLNYSSTISNYSGWLAQRYFGNNATNNNFIKCFNANGNVSTYGGGIVGANSNITVNACGFSANIIANEGGGICGNYSISRIQNSYTNVSANNLYSSSGGLCGSYSKIDASNCYVIGSTQGNAGAFTGIYCSGTIYNSYSVGSIYGFIGASSTVTVTNSYNSSSNNNWYDSTALSIINNVIDGVNVGEPVTWLDLTTPQFEFTIPFALSVFVVNIYNVNNITIDSLPFNTVAGINSYNNFNIVSVGLNGSTYGSVLSQFPFISINSTTGVITFNKNAYSGYYSVLVYAYNTILYTYGLNTFNCTINGKDPPIITSSIYMNQSYIDNNVWPAQIQSSTGESIIITFTENLVFTDPLQYFIVLCNNVTIDGQNYRIDISGINYPGLVQNGTVSQLGFNFITIQNLLTQCINNATAYGIYGQNYYGNGGNNNLIQNCFMNGNSYMNLLVGDYCNVNFNKCGILNGSRCGIMGSNATTTINNCFINGNGESTFIYGSGGGTKIINQSYIFTNIYYYVQGGPFAPLNTPVTINNSYFLGTKYIASPQGSFVYTQTNVYNTNVFNIGDAYNTLVGANGTIWNSFVNPFILATFNEKIYHDSSNNPNITSLPYQSPQAIINNKYTNYSILSINKMTASFFPNITIDNSGVITFNNTTYDSTYYVNVYQSDNYGRYNSNYFICSIQTGILKSNAINSTTYINQAYVNSVNWPIPIQGGNIINPINIYVSEDIIFTTTKQYFIIDSSYVTFNGNNQKIILQNINGYPGLFQNGSIIQTPTFISYFNGYSNIMIKNIIIYNTGSVLNIYNGWFGQQYYGYNANNNIFYNCFNSNGDIPSYGGGIVGSNSVCDISVCAVYANNLNSYSGGIIGPYSNVNIYNCYVNIVSNIYSNAGGISASNNTLLIRNSYIIGNLTSNSNVGAICGSNCTGFIYNCYNLSITSSASSNIFGTSFINSNNIYSSILNGWSDNDASNKLISISTITRSSINNTWTRLSLSALSSAGLIPYKLNAFNIPIYTINNVRVSNLPYYSSNGSSLFNSFSIIAVYLSNTGIASRTLPTTISIDSRTGVITLSSLLATNDTYTIRILAQNTTYNFYSINSFIVTIPSNVNKLTSITNLIAEDCFVHYKFDSKDILYTTLFNYTTETYDTTLYNSPVLDSINYAIGSTSISLLNTSKQYVYNNNVDFGINSGNNLNTNGISFSFWVKTRATNPFQITQSLFYLSDTMNYSNGNVIYMRYLYNGTYQGLEITNGKLSDISNTIFITNPPSLDGTWHHMVFIIPSNNGSTINGASCANNWQLYIDNSAVILPSFTNGSSNYPFNTIYNNLYIGAMPTLVDGSLNNFFNGNIDDFRIYNRVLNTYEITNLYTLEINPPTNYILNNYFSNGSTNWTLLNGAYLFYQYSNNPTSTSVFIPPTQGTVITNSLFQNIILPAGTYRFMFDVFVFNSGVTLFGTIGSVTIFSTIPSGYGTWTHYSRSFNLTSTQTGFTIGTNNNNVYGISFIVTNFAIFKISSQFNVPIYGVDNVVDVIQLPFYSWPGVSSYNSFTINTINNLSPANYPFITIDNSNGILIFDITTPTNITYVIDVNAFNNTNYMDSNSKYTANISSNPTIYTISSNNLPYDYFLIYSFNTIDVINNNVINYGAGLYDLSLKNAASIDTVNYIGKTGSLKLNRTSNQYALNTNLGLTINASTNTNVSGISICFWQKTNIFISPQTLFYISDVSNSLSANVIYMKYAINGNNGIEITVGHIRDNSNTIFIPNIYTNDGNWHHFAFIIPDNSGSAISGNTTSSPWKLYIDNVLYTLPSFTNGSNVYPLDASYNNLYLGAMPDISVNIMNYFNGNIDEFIIYNRALSVIEVTNIYSNAIYRYNQINSPPNDFYTLYYLSIQEQYSGTSDLWNYGSQSYDASMINGAIINGPTYGIGNTSLSLNNNSPNYVFNAGNQYVYNQNLGLTINSTTNTNTNGISFSFWAYTSSTNIQSFFSITDFSNNYPQNIYNMINMRFTNPGIEIIVRDSSNNVNNCVLNGVTVNDGKWHHFMLIIPNNGNSNVNGNNTSSPWQLYIDNISYVLSSSFQLGSSIYPYNSLYTHLTIGAKRYNDFTTNSIISEYFTGYIDDFQIYTRTLTRQEIKNIYFTKNFPVTNFNTNIPFIDGFVEKFNYLKVNQFATFGIDRNYRYPTYFFSYDTNNFFNFLTGYDLYVSPNFINLFTGIPPNPALAVTNYRGDWYSLNNWHSFFESWTLNTNTFWTSTYNFYDQSSNFIRWNLSSESYNNSIYSYLGKYLYFDNSGNYSISFFLTCPNSVGSLSLSLDNSAVIINANSIYTSVIKSTGTNLISNPQNLINLYKSGGAIYYYLTFQFLNVSIGRKYMKIQFNLINDLITPYRYNASYFISNITVKSFINPDVSASFNLYSENPIIWMDSNDVSTLFNNAATTDRNSIDMYTYTANGIPSSINGWRNKGWMKNNITWTNPITYNYPTITLNNNPSSAFNSLNIYSIFFVASYTNGSVFSGNNGLLGNGTINYVYGTTNTTNIATSLQNSTIYINGTQTQTITNIKRLNIIEIVCTSSNTLTNACVGLGDTGTRWYGDIAEVVMFDKPITNDIRQKVEAHLTDKWNLQYQLDSSNTYLNINTFTPTTYVSSVNPTVVSNEYNYHIFTNSSTITFTSEGSVDYLIIGGGGAGGNNHGGGGGAGGIISGTTVVNSTSYSVIVGSGGNTIGGGSNSTNGGNSSVFGITGVGGGHGGGALNGVATSGGSGGGGSGYTTSGTAGSSNSYDNLGNNGGNSNQNPGGGGGGGGAGSAGNLNNENVGGIGGSGTINYSSWLSVINSYMSSTWQSATNNGQVIASGGSGGSWAQYSVSGPIGGGGSGGNDNGGITLSPTNAVANTGGGGGGGGSGGQIGANGGSGIVIIRYKTSGDLVSITSKNISYIPSIIDTSNTALYLYKPTNYLKLDTTSADTGFNPSVISNYNVNFTTIAGKQCAYFNNSINTYLSMPFIYQMNNFSFAFWVYTIDNNYYTCANITNAGFYGNGQVTMNLDINGNQWLRSFIAMPSPWIISPQITINTVQNWTHLTYTFDLNNYFVTIYVNGIQQTQSIGTGVFPSSAAVQFALGKGCSNERAFNGYIRQFLFYNKILTDSEILDIYNNTM